jgi:predicted flap endonuclease-1-like 5' DNA nuclease
MEQSAELDRMRRAKERADERVRTASSQVDAQDKRAEAAERLVRERDEDLSRLRSQHDSLRSLTAVRAERIRELEQQSGLAERSVRELEGDKAELEARIEALEAERRSQRDALDSLSRERDAAMAANDTTAPDDLRQIYGIGPKYERLLHEAGITTYAQIAGWTDDDVEQVAVTLKIRAARIKKAAWVDSAKALLAGPHLDAAENDEPTDLNW